MFRRLAAALTRIDTVVWPRPSKPASTAIERKWKGVPRDRIQYHSIA